MRPAARDDKPASSPLLRTQQRNGLAATLIGCRPPRRATIRAVAAHRPLTAREDATPLAAGKIKTLTDGALPPRSHAKCIADIWAGPNHDPNVGPPPLSSRATRHRRDSAARQRTAMAAKRLAVFITSTYWPQLLHITARSGPRPTATSISGRTRPTSYTIVRATLIAGLNTSIGTAR